MATISSGIAKIRREVPDSTSRWSDQTIGIALFLADTIIRESCEMRWATTEITLLPNVLYYELPAGAVAVGAVEYTTDGTNYDQYIISPADLDDLDNRDREWRDRTGTRPELFSLIGAPGASSSRILLWPAMSSVTAEKARVVYLGAYTANNLSFASATAPEVVIERVYVPLALSLLYGGSHEADMANYYLASAMRGMSWARGMFVSKYGDAVPVDPAMRVSRLGGQV